MLALLAAQLKFKLENGKLGAEKPIWVDVSVYHAQIVEEDIFCVMEF